MRKKRLVFGAVSLSLILGMSGCNVTKPGTDPSGVVTKEETSAGPETEESSKAKEETSGKSEETSVSQTEHESSEETEQENSEETENGSENETEESQTGSEGTGKAENLTFVTDESWKSWAIEGVSRVSITDPKPRLLQADFQNGSPVLTPSVAAYTVDQDLGNVANLKDFPYFSTDMNKLAENRFVVSQKSWDEFYEVYEDNRYQDHPSFVTTDSLMHTYHLYYQKLQKQIEKEDLNGELKSLTKGMLEESLQQYSLLRGTEWEQAAGRNVAYFAVAAEIFGLEARVPAELQDMIEAEVSKIKAAKGVGTNGITPEKAIGEDYTQYIPRSYYAGDSELEDYFRVMMWYGRITFAQKYEEENRSALLMNIALADENNYKNWYNIYEVTTFLIGSSDDLLYTDYLPIISRIYGTDFVLEDLVGNDEAFEKFEEEIAGLRDPEITSDFVGSDDPFNTEDLDWRKEVKGYRFLGQRFSLDAKIFQNLIYNDVQKAADDSKRQLPDALDIPAAFGSDVALDILIEKGNDKYPNYLDQMDKMREEVKNSDEYWDSSVYGAWLYTLMPLLEEKGEGYPSFMTNEEWQKKDLEGFLGSWTELKHDTQLYAKQPYALPESGGDEREPRDDRGYVEPEWELYERLRILTETTKNGLKELGYLKEADETALDNLNTICVTLRDISVKELKGQSLSDEDYDFIRSYGSSLEHFWYDTIAVEIDTELSHYDAKTVAHTTLVSDVATGFLGDDTVCLQEAVGDVCTIYVIFPIDGELHIGVGGVYSQYQFTSPIDQRMTDEEWEKAFSNWESKNTYQTPDWTMSYRS
ncbi:MAG: DUF3160 domain-containing protein [Lachnospiraceae bacterium]|nr:DUF3160 domain-containing protein [Lachnospiraceae bacterium]